MIPEDPAILLSYVNTRLRDEYADLEELSAALGVPTEELDARLRAAGFTYDETQNRYK